MFVYSFLDKEKNMGNQDDSDYKQFPCKCKSFNCVWYIVREGSRWRINKKFKQRNFICCKHGNGDMDSVRLL